MLYVLYKHLRRAHSSQSNYLCTNFFLQFAFYSDAYGNHITVPRAGLRVQYTAAVKIICGNVTGDGFFSSLERTYILL